MGLDMYLTRKGYVGAEYEHYQIVDKEFSLVDEE